MEGGARKLWVQPIALDPSPVGLCVLPAPIGLGSLTVHSLGEVITNQPGFRDETILYSVGYCCT